MPGSNDTRNGIMRVLLQLGHLIRQEIFQECRSRVGQHLDIAQCGQVLVRSNQSETEDTRRSDKKAVGGISMTKLNSVSFDGYVVGDRRFVDRRGAQGARDPL